MPYVLCFEVELCKTLGSFGKVIKISTLIKKFLFWVNHVVLIKNKNDFF